MKKNHRARKKEKQICLKSLEKKMVLDFAQNLIELKIIREKLFANESFSLKIGEVDVFIRGSYTVAIIDREYIGISKFNPADKSQNNLTGTSIAINRAIIELLDPFQRV